MENDDCVSLETNETHGYSSDEIKRNMVCAGYMNGKIDTCQSDTGQSYENELCII